ncbi:MAG: 4-hydroxy-3-methylbut-2-enyl diphosphate reductase [Alphaproteobacteria bacterium ADurb.Bin438]|nr:MAG: 4-hydroxy-3-methylbut-2-enyl diphosphate reductase [Alphaproteobacteria bacterium ADurb.Bin438]
MNQRNLKIILCIPRGFCAGVTRAIETVEKALEKFDYPVYVRHEIVHNKYVVDKLKEKGAIFIEELDEIEDYSTVIFSAHGVPESVKSHANSKHLNSIDATCPLVEKVHKKVKRNFENNITSILIGHKNHPEVIGTMGQVPHGAIILVSKVQEVEKLDPNLNVAYVTQTTLSVDETSGIFKALKQKYPYLKEDNDICFATTNRQKAVKEIAPKCDKIFVVGAPNSSNSKRLVEVAIENGCKNACLIQNESEIDWNDFDNINVLGITAGASAPEILIDNILKKAKNYFNIEIENSDGKEENLNFKLPKGI